MADLQVLKEREDFYKEQYAIKETANGFKLTEKDTFLSDSVNPQGEWQSYDKEINTYKSRAGAINAIKRLVAQNFPAGYNINSIMNVYNNADIKATEKSEQSATNKPNSKYYITPRQREQAERMAKKWAARSEAFYAGGDGWGVDTAGYCKTPEDAEQAQDRADKINAAISSLSSGSGTWADVQVIRAAVSDRDGLDAGITVNQEVNKNAPEIEPRIGRRGTDNMTENEKMAYYSKRLGISDMRYVVEPHENSYFIRDTVTDSYHGEDTAHGKGLVTRYTNEAAAYEAADILNTKLADRLSSDSQEQIKETLEPKGIRFKAEYDGSQYYYIRNTESNDYYSKSFGVPMRFVHEDTANKYVKELNDSISIDDKFQKTEPGNLSAAEIPPAAPELSEKEAAILAHEGARALRDIGEDSLEPRLPHDMHGDIVPDAAIDDRNYDYIDNMWKGEQKIVDIPQTKDWKIIEPDKLALDIRSIYTQVKNADPEKVAGVAAINTAIKRIQKIVAELPPPKTVNDLGYKELYDTAADICKKHSPNITVNTPAADRAEVKTSLLETSRDLSTIADVHAGWDKSPAKTDLKKAFAEKFITGQERTADIAYNKFNTHMALLGVGRSISDTPQYFQDYYSQKKQMPMAKQGIKEKINAAAAKIESSGVDNLPHVKSPAFAQMSR